MLKKVFSAVVAVAFVFSIVPTASAQTIEELQAQVAQLLAQLSALQGGAPTSGAGCYTFTQDLTLGSTGTEVTNWQMVLVDAGNLVMPAGVSFGYFGPLTQSASAAWQAAHGVAPAVGYVGPLTRGAYAASCVPTNPTNPTDPTDPSDPTPGNLEGGAGSVDEYDLVSGLQSEEVGEDEDDVEVAGLEIENSDDGGIEVKAVRIDLAQGTATNDDFSDFADEVSIWWNGEMLASVDADDFDEDNGWERTISLDDGAILDSGETGELIVAMTGASNIDSTDEGDTWILDFETIRFRDAQNTTISEDPGTGVITFSFESFASATDSELNLNEDDENINEGRTIQIDDTDDTDNEPVLSFAIEVEGDSDLELDNLFVNFDSVGIDLEDMVSGTDLIMDGDEVGSEVFPAGAGTDETIDFDDLDLILDAGEIYFFLVTVDFNSIADGIADGDTIEAQITSTERDLFDVEDESGEDLASSDRTGTVDGEPLGVFENGIQVEFIDADENKTSSDTSGINETVEFVLTFDVTAFGEDIWLDQTCAVGTTGTDVDALEVSLDGDADGSSTTCTDFESVDADEGTDGFEVKEGQTERFTVNVLGDGGEATGAGSSVTFTARINGIGYNVETDAVGDTVYAFDLDDYESAAVTVFDR